MPKTVLQYKYSEGREQRMSIEKLPDCYCAGAPARIGWRIGTVLLRIGHYHLIWWNVSTPAWA